MAKDEDLGALFARITRQLIDAERPLLHARGLSMWAYIALTRLVDAPAPTQLALAAQMGYDKTRLIPILDQLTAEGLIARRPDPQDRRARIVELTPEGRGRHAAARADIRAMESEMLAGLGAAEQTALRRMLVRLATRPTQGETNLPG
jgi:DNA-binding MarR family transcriptional regulator